MKKAQEKKFDVAAMRKIRWMSGVTILDRIRNERIRGTAEVGQISKKLQECRLTWYGHVLRGTRIENRRRMCVQESDGDGDAWEKKDEDRSGSCWITSGTTCRR